MNNTQKFIASEFDYISSNVPETSRVFKPTITISHGIAKTKHISISWEQLELIKQLLIDTSKDN